MIEREQLIEFVEGIVTKEQLENVASVGQVDELSRKLQARLDVQQGQLDGLQALVGAMQVKITQLQLQIARMEEFLVEKDSEAAAAHEQAENMVREEQPKSVETVASEEAVKPVVPVEPEEPSRQKQPEEPISPEQPAQPVEKEPAKEAVAKPTIADTIKGEESLAEKLSKRVKNETVAASINSAKIDRIQTAITIADRFRFQRELFAGDAVKMAETVETLNNMKSLDEALAYIEKNFNWDVESQVAMDFIRIVERRF